MTGVSGVVVGVAPAVVVAVVGVEKTEDTASHTGPLKVEGG